MPEPVGTPGAGTGSLQGLLDPGSARGFMVAGDEAILDALLRAEIAWAAALAETGRASPRLPLAVAAAARDSPPELESMAHQSSGGGNPVIPLVEHLRESLRRGEDGDALAALIHRGLTSQDVVDTALMLVVRDVFDALVDSMVRVGDRLADLATAHCGTLQAGRTLTQHAVPVTLGLKASQWLTSVTEVLGEVRACRAQLPVQCGGAAGTLAALAVLEGERPGSGGLLSEDEAPARFAGALGLVWPGRPWHTRRRPVTRVADVLAGVLDALGHLATDLTVLARPEVGEVVPAPAAGRGGSSTMPHKRNPVGAVLVRSAALQAGPLAGLLHQCAALAVDERSDGAWHAEWPVLQRLCMLAVSASEQAAEVVDGLEVDTARIAATAAAAADALLSEWHGLSTLPGTRTVPAEAGAADYTGAARELVAQAVERWSAARKDDA